MPFSSTNILSGLKRRSRQFRRNTGWWLGAGNSFIKNARTARILVYHGVCRQDPFRFSTLYIKLKTFEHHLQHYKKYFNTVSLDDFFKGQFSSDRPAVCLSFDDGFANNYTAVLPLLEKYRVPAAFFITGIRESGNDILWTDFLRIAGRNGPPEFEWSGNKFRKGSDHKYRSVFQGKRLDQILRGTGTEEKIGMMERLSVLGFQVSKPDMEYCLQLTSEQISALSKSEWATIGSHGYFHNDLARLPEPIVMDELTRSKNFLEGLTGKEIKALAFPYGSYTPQVITVAKKAGYQQLLATEFLNECDSKDPLMRERLTINPFISTVSQMYANVRGNYE